MVANILTNQVFKSIPKTFGSTLNGYDKLTDKHYEDGFRELVIPELEANEKLTDWFYDEDVDMCFYNKETIPDDEYKQILIDKSIVQKQILISNNTEKIIIKEAQQLSDEDALNQKDLYPFWSGDSVSYSLNFKVLDFTKSNELALYKVVQAHTSQRDWKPKDVPALFTRIQLDEVLDWVQPTGAQDAYQIGDKVIYPSGSGQVWESTVNANVFAPGVVAGQWLQLQNKK
jgi:hypothetical protein